MFTPLQCIALRTVRSGESRAILSAWSREAGRVSLGLADGKGREAARRRALTMPLSLFEAVADVRPGREIMNVRDLRPLGTGTAAPGAALTLVRLFLADVLDSLLRQGASDPALSDFLFSSIQRMPALKSPTTIANFHLIFLFRLARFLGIAPDTAVPAGADPDTLVFDLRDACFRTSLPAHPLFYTGPEAAAARLLGRLDFDTMRVARFSREERARILDAIIDYYHLHLSSVSLTRSLEVLRQFS